MKKRVWAWLLAALCAVCLTVVENWHVREAMPIQISRSGNQTTKQLNDQNTKRPNEATLTDATQLYRICSSRPQRLLKTATRSGRTLTPSFHCVRQHIVKPLHSYFDSRCRTESAPFCLSASRDYYVIALRHIIR